MDSERNKVLHLVQLGLTMQHSKQMVMVSNWIFIHADIWRCSTLALVNDGSNARIFNGTALYDPTKERVTLFQQHWWCSQMYTKTKLLCCQSNTSATPVGTFTRNQSGSITWCMQTETQQQPTSTHSTLISTQFVDKRLVMLL